MKRKQTRFKKTWNELSGLQRASIIPKLQKAGWRPDEFIKLIVMVDDKGRPVSWLDPTTECNF